jgi:8-oxo-dGTP pyrophosphatase MutT (NUDIX family)
MTALISLAEQLKLHANENLPGINAHRTMLPEGRTMPDNYLSNTDNYKQSAVFALLFQEEENINLLLTQRHQYEGKHSGQISFPGGKKEDTDENLLNTAYRETYEEVGIEQKNIQFIAPLTPLYIPVSNFFVQPYLGYLTASTTFKINEREVKSIVKFPIHFFSQANIIKTKKIEASSGFFLSVPAYELNETIIWGATAMMLSEIGTLLKSISKV